MAGSERALQGAAAALAQRSFRVPLFLKILGANAATVAVVAALVWGAARLLHGTLPGPGAPLVLAVTAAVALAVGVNALVVRLALRPLRQIEETVRRVEEGRPEARVPESALADARLARLAAGLNRVLERQEADGRRLRDLAARALWAQEAERRRLAAELQDHAAQELGALLLRLRVARRATDQAVRDAVLDEIRTSIVSLTEEMRRFVRGLHPPVLEELGLGAAVEAYGRALGEASPVRVQVESTLHPGSLDAEALLVLYRTIQEALANAVRHAGATTATVRLASHDGAAVAEVADDGAGFDVEATLSDEPCLGLVGMQERVAYFGGTVEIASARGRGTRVRIRLPRASGRNGAARPATPPDRADLPAA